jgi:hypothetical protein
MAVHIFSAPPINPNSQSAKICEICGLITIPINVKTHPTLNPDKIDDLSIATDI